MVSGSEGGEAMERRRRMRPAVMLRMVILVFCLFFAVQLVSLQLQVTDLRAQSEELDDEISRKQLANKELEESQLDSDSDEAIAKIARDVLGYASPGEKVYIDSSKQ